MNTRKKRKKGPLVEDVHPDECAEFLELMLNFPSMIERFRKMRAGVGTHPTWSWEKAIASTTSPTFLEDFARYPLRIQEALRRISALTGIPKTTILPFIQTLNEKSGISFKESLEMIRGRAADARPEHN